MSIARPVITKSTGLAKSSPAVRAFAQKLDRALQTRNERIARADSDYVEACSKALKDIEVGEGETEPAVAPAAEPASVQ